MRNANGLQVGERSGVLTRSARCPQIVAGAIAVVLTSWVPLRGAESAWTVGAGALDWSSWVQTSSAVEFVDGGAGIRLVSFAESENIVERLDWTATGTPQDYVTHLPHGRVWDNNPLRDAAATLSMVDGDSTTSTGERFKQLGAIYAGTSLFYDLGTRYPVKRFSFFPRQTGADAEGRRYRDDFVRSYEILVQNGERFTENNLPIYQTPPLRVVQFTTNSVAVVPFPPQFVRYIRLRVTSNVPFELAEFEVFGRGFSPRGGLVSKVVDLQDEANFNRLTWKAHGLRQDDAGSLNVVDDADARVEVLMRTGSTPHPQLHYEIVDQNTGERVQVTEAEYKGLEPHQQGGIEDDQSRWSLWSPPWTEPDIRIDLPSPRRYLQFQIRMDSRAILDGVGMSSLSVSYATPPLARELLAEISLEDEPVPPGGMPIAPAGEYSTFVYDLRADVRRTDVGFSALEISTPARPVFGRLERGSPSWDDLAPTAEDSVTTTDSSLVVYFQPVRSLAYLRVVFSAQLFNQATSFDSQVRNTQVTEPPQKVLPGDAHPGVQTLESSALRVLTSEKSARTLMSSLSIAPPVLTPNGDGVNDVAVVSYTLTQLLAPVPVAIAVCDLSGRCVRSMTESRSSGSHIWEWDGRNNVGRLVPVGTYVVRVVLNADRKDAEGLGVVALVY